MATEETMKIAVLRRNAYGDMISSLPAINYLKEQHPQHKLYIFVSTRNFSLTKYLFPNDHVVLIKDGNKYFQTLKAALKYRSIGFDIGLAPFPDYIKLQNVFFLVLGAKKRFFRKINDNAPGSYYAKLESADLDQTIHTALANLKLINPNISAIESKWYPQIDRSLIKKFTTGFSGTKIFVSISNNREEAQLTIENLHKILNALFEKNKFSVIISCLKTEQENAERLINLLNAPAKYFITDNFDDFLGLLNDADIVFGGEGGTCHIAGCLDKKIVALYGLTNVLRWGVLSNKAVQFFDKENVNNIDQGKIIMALDDFLNE